MATSEFGKAFREARASGDKTFTFKGKKYTTDLAPAEQKSIGTKSKMGEYVPRDSDTRKGEIMTSKNAVGRDNYTRSGQKSMDTETEPSEIMANKDRDMGMGQMARKSPYVYDEHQGGVHADAGYGSKRGGLMKAKKMASGGMTSSSSASKRADGCCVKGKTRGKMV